METISTVDRVMRLLPSQIAVYWDIIKIGLQEILPPTTTNSPEGMNSILTNLIAGSMQVWFYTRGEGKDAVFYGFTITHLQTDVGTGKPYLTFYAIYGFEKVPHSMWKVGEKVLTTFARNNDCTCIVGYTNNPTLLDHAQLFGYTKEWSIVRKEL